MWSSLWQQHTDPVGFVTQHPAGVIWWPEWHRRGMVAGGLLLILILVALVWQTPSMIGWGLIAFFAWMMPISLPLMLTGYIQYWLLYILSPLRVAGALLFGLYPLAPELALTLSWGIAFPFSFGVGATEASVLWVRRQAETKQRQQERHHVGGPTATLPELRWNLRGRQLRLWATIATLVGASLVIIVWPQEIAAALPLVTLAAGLFRLDILLLGTLRRTPLVSDTRRPTTFGRFTLLAPSPPVKHLYQRAAPDAALALLSLLREGQLAPVLRQGVTHLPVTEGHLLLLHLSLHAGGAAALTYLHPALPLALRPYATGYAALATNAAHPLARQPWRATLAHSPLLDGTSNPALGTIAQTLCAARSGFDCDSLHAFDATGAINGMQSLAQKVSTESAAAKAPVNPSAWPFALLAHLEGHRQRLRSP